MSSFHCPHCGATDGGIQSGAPIQDHGVRYSLQIHDSEVHIYVHTYMYVHEHSDHLHVDVQVSEDTILLNS